MMRTLRKIALLLGTVTPIVPVAGKPKSFGVLLIPGFDALDAFGPLEYINALPDTTVSLISETLNPVWSFGLNATMSTIVKVGMWHQPTHTFATAPQLDALLVIGGIGSRAISTGSLAGYIGFIKDRYPTLQYLLTVCTGNALSAAAGVLDGRKATGNKRSWAFVTAQGPNVSWVAKARWVVDSEIWSASGVEAGTDMIYSFVKEVYSEKTADTIAKTFEHLPHKDPSWDPFADLYNTTGTLIPPAPAPPPLAGYPKSYGILAYPGVGSFEILGAFEYLWGITTGLAVNITVIAPDLSPIRTNMVETPLIALTGTGLPHTGQVFRPDYTLSNAPDVEVLVVPGAPRVIQDERMSSFIRERYPKLRHLISVGTGSALVAQSGVVGNSSVTTSKRFYAKTKDAYPLVNWEPNARWVISQNEKLWTGSGGAALMDMMNAFISRYYGDAFGVHVANSLEYVPNTNPFLDVFPA